MPNLISRLAKSPSERARLARFIVVGGGLTALDFLIFRALLFQGMEADNARLSASLTCLVVSYPLHRRFSFRSSLSTRETVLAYFFTRAVAALIVQSAFVLCHEYLRMGDDPAFWVSSVLYPLVNFLLASRVVFKK